MELCLLSCLDSDRLRILELANLCFEKDMSLAVPVLYDTNQKSMNFHYAVIYEDHIVALFCLLEREMVFGNDVIKMAGIGSVCVHPDYRNQGILQFMMHEANQMISCRNYDLAYLSGIYERYHHFGYEYSQSCSYYEIAYFDLKCGDKFRFDPMTYDDFFHVSLCVDLYNRREVKVKRSVDDFVFCCSQWRRIGYFIFQDNHLIGYLVYHSVDHYIEEIVLQNYNLFDEVLKSFMESFDLSILLLKVSDLDYEMRALCNSRFHFMREEQTKYLFQIRNLEKIIFLCLQYRIKFESVETGKLVLSILNYGVIEIEVGIDEVFVRRVDGVRNGDLNINWWEAEQLLLNCYLFHNEADEVIRLCSSWFPLPIYLLAPDLI